jgi:hypothetical protein
LLSGLIFNGAAGSGKLIALKGQDFCRAAKAIESTWALQAADKLVSDRLCISRPPALPTRNG